MSVQHSITSADSRSSALNMTVVEYMDALLNQGILPTSRPPSISSNAVGMLPIVPVQHIGRNGERVGIAVLRSKMLSWDGRVSMLCNLPMHPLKLYRM